MKDDFARLLHAATTLHPKEVSNQTDLANFLGDLAQSAQALTNWKKRGLPKNKLNAIARRVGCSIDYLESGTGPMVSPLGAPNIATPPRPISPFQVGDPITDDEIEVPVLGLKLSAGHGHIQWEIDQTGRRHRYDKRWIDNLGIRDPERLTTVRIEGDSMWPGIPDSSSVVLYTGSLTLRSGEVYAIDYMNEFFIKRLFKEPDGSLRIVSDNPDKNRYPDIRVAPEFAESLRVLGVAVEVKRTLIGRVW